MLRVYVLSLTLVLALGSSGWGQDAPPAKPSPPVKVVPKVKKPATKNPIAPKPAAKKPIARQSAEKKQSGAKAKAPDAKPPLRQEHIIYLPFENLRDVFEHEDSSIVLPYAQFLEMWNRLVQPDKQPIKPPVNGVITRADYMGSVKGEQVHLEATLDVEVLSAEWAQLPVEFGDAAIGAARTKDGAVLLRGVGQGRYELLIRGKGKHQIKLSLVTAVRSAVEGRSFTIQCPAVGVSNLELEIPEKDLAVHVTPHRTSELHSDVWDTTRVRAVLGSTKQFTVSWQPKSGSSDKAAGLANVTDTIAVDVGDGVVHTHAIFDYQILRGSIGELIVEVPKDQRLLDVQMPGMRDWKTETADGRQQVTVRLHAPATEKVRLELHTESPVSEKTFQVGQIRAVGVARESGILAVRSAEDVGLEYVERESITRIDAADAPETLRKPGSTFYKFFTPEHKLSVLASQLKPRIVVDSHLSVLLGKSRLTTRGEFEYQVSRSGIFSLELRLPADFQVDDVHAESMDHFEVTPASDAQTLTVYFTKKLLGKLKIAVTASQSCDKPAGELELPLLEPLNVTREQGLVAVMAPESLEVKTDSTKLKAALAATPAELASKGFKPQPPGGAMLAAAFSFVTRPVSIVQTITERPRRTFVTVGTEANIKEDVVQVTTKFRYNIQFAGTNTFRLAVPAAVSDRLQVEGDGIKERRKAAKASDDGTVEWTIVLHSETLGPFEFTATYDQMISIPEEGMKFELQPIKVLDADRETGEIAIHKSRALSVDASPTGLEEIDPRELSRPFGNTQPYLTYRYYQHPVQLALSVTKHELQDVVKTVVRRAYIEAVITEDGPMTLRARYDLKSSERQRLAVTLRNPRILGITVAGQTVAPEKAPAATSGSPEDKTYFINVARTSDSDEPFQIAMVFETPRAEEELKVTDLISVALPKFDEGVKFQKVYVRIWMPKDYRLVGNPEGFASHIGVGLWDSRKITSVPDNPDNWFPKDTLSFDFQVGGTTYLFSSLTDPTELKTTYWHIPTMTTIASLVVLAIGIVLLRFSLETKVFVILTAVFVILFIGLFSPSFINSWLLAARLGIAGVVAIWLVAWLLHVRRNGGYSQWLGSQNATSSTSPATSNAPPQAEKSVDTPLAESVAEATDSSGNEEKSNDAPLAGEPEDATDKPERGQDEH
ncbi:MAG: hypothetical protein JXM70_07605 [Pirellulales bacterium]|nr:hypothetical protein [Pirellulales bacterium]